VTLKALDWHRSTRTQGGTDMKFAAKSPGGSNGQAAWAAVYGLMKVLRFQRPAE